MRNTSEMALAVRARALEKRRRRMRGRLALLGGVSGMLCAALVVLIGALDRPLHRALSVDYAGAALLFEGAGGYVLVAVAAFMIGAGVAVACVRGRRRH